MSFKRLFPLFLVLPGIVACSEPAANSGPAAADAQSSSDARRANTKNSFFTVSELPYRAPPFDRIEDRHFQPAIEEGRRRQLAEIQQIADSNEPPTFGNTIEAMERSGALLERTMQVFSAVVQANTNDTLQRIQKEEAPKLAAHRDAIYLNEALFQRVDGLYRKRNELDLDSEQSRLLEEIHTDFIRAGAELSDAEKEALKSLNQEESTLTTEFQLQNTTQQPALDSLAERELRAELLWSSEHRSDQGGPNDTRELIKRLVELRAEKARLPGYPTYADYVLVERMAKTPETAIELLTDIVPAATAKARAEAARMQVIIDEEGGDFELTAHDWEYYAEKVRKAEYDLDESQIKPYFELNRVLRDGVFYAANRLYGLTFKERHDLPVYHPDVRVFEIFEADGTPLALFYGDYFKRDNKSGGAWMSEFVSQSKLLGTKPVVYNVANFTKPAEGQPALLSFDDVETMFHEFGHALHGMFSEAAYPSLAGTDVPRDFVEFPSQFNEHWALEPEVLAHYAKHYKSGDDMPRALVEKIENSRTFNQGYDTTEYLAAALVDMAWHTLPSDAPRQNVGEFENEALARFNVDLETVPPRYHSTYFSHIFDGGYAAGYYSYLWSEVLDHDAYYWFVDNGGMTRENGERFREMILSRGNTKDPAVLYHAFTGRDPSVEPLLIERGLKGAGPT